MLQLTMSRLRGLSDSSFEIGAPIVVCNEEHRFLVAEHARLSGIELRAIVLEPDGRNTAPALTAANLILADDSPDALGLMMPADHLIGDVDAFHAAIVAAAKAAADDRLTTFGVVPSHAETGYGYIHIGEPLEGVDSNKTAPRELNRFVEKPDLATAEAYLESGDYLWNSGMFLIKANVWERAIGSFAPAILAAVRESVAKAEHDKDFLRLEKASFQSSPSDSIDYAVMEKLQESSEFHGAVVPLDAQWSDIGAWSSVWDISERDENDNAIIGDGQVIDGTNNVVFADQRFVGTVGVSNVVVVETADAVLVADRDRAQDVKKLVAWLEKEGRGEGQLHRKVFRPWGSYEGVDEGERFQVKRIIVKPGEKLSLQMHHHRAEHWIVVRGTARVTRGEDEFMVSENESTFIPLGTTHRLENPGKIPLELIEVQSGAYLGEDDIIRFEDVYSRS